MHALATLTDKTMIIPGRIAARPQTPKPMRATGVTLLGSGRRAGVKLGNRTVILRSVRLVTRPSGRKRHLSRYLVGIDVVTGKLLEIFLEAVKGTREMCFRLKETLRRGVLKLISQGLNLRQMIEIAGGVG